MTNLPELEMWMEPREAGYCRQATQVAPGLAGSPGGQRVDWLATAESAKFAEMGTEVVEVSVPGHAGAPALGRAYRYETSHESRWNEF